MIAFLGGTGPEGRGLAMRLAMAGEEVVIGSRDQSRARETAEAISSLAPNLRVSGEHYTCLPSGLSLHIRTELVEYLYVTKP